jgi:hypothetical protein
MLERKNRELQNLCDKLLHRYTMKIEPAPTIKSGATAQ